MGTAYLKREIEKICKDLTLNELLEVEEIVLQILKEKMKANKESDWKNDFLEISTWSHIDKNGEIKISSWEINAF